MLDGTIRLVVNAGTWGGQTYTAQTLYFNKCTHGQVWNSGANDCTGTGNSGNNYGAIITQFCTINDNSCNGGNVSNPVSSGAVFNACNGLSFAGKSWRVPSENELKLLINCTSATEMPIDGSACGAYTSPVVNNFFPNTVAFIYWSSTASTLTGAWTVYFHTSLVNQVLKNDPTYFVRCVSD